MVKVGNQWGRSISSVWILAAIDLVRLVDIKLINFMKKETHMSKDEIQNLNRVPYIASQSSLHRQKECNGYLYKELHKKRIVYILVLSLILGGQNNALTECRMVFFSLRFRP